MTAPSDKAVRLVDELEEAGRDDEFVSTAHKRYVCKDVRTRLLAYIAELEGRK